MVEWNEIFQLFRFSGILGQPREVHPKLRNEIPENVCSIIVTMVPFAPPPGICGILILVEWKAPCRLFIVGKASVYAAGIVFLILTGALRAVYTEFKLQRQIDIFQFEHQLGGLKIDFSNPASRHYFSFHPAVINICIPIPRG